MTIDLSNLTTGQGFIIQGDMVSDLAGFSVSNAGDVNGTALMISSLGLLKAMMAAPMPVKPMLFMAAQG